jgi:hypothetical protein
MREETRLEVDDNSSDEEEEQQQQQQQRPEEEEEEEGEEEEEEEELEMAYPPVWSDHQHFQKQQQHLLGRQQQRQRERLRLPPKREVPQPKRKQKQQAQHNQPSPARRSRLPVQQQLKGKGGVIIEEDDAKVAIAVRAHWRNEQIVAEKNRSMLVRFYEQADPTKLTERAAVQPGAASGAGDNNHDCEEEAALATQLAVDAILAYYGSDVQALRRALGRKYGHAPRFIAYAHGIYVAGNEKSCTSFASYDQSGRDSPGARQSAQELFDKW